MAVIRNEQADEFVKSPQGGSGFFLLHGTDDGLIHERAKTLVKALNAGDSGALGVVRLDSAAAGDPGRLADEAYATSMFGGLRTIWLDAGGRDLTPRLRPLFERRPDGCALIVEAGNLKKDAPLRLLFEQAVGAFAVECYPDGPQALVRLIAEVEREWATEISSDAKRYLASLIGADRLTTRSELAKLGLYILGQKTVDVADIEAVVTEAAPTALDELIDCALRGDLRDVEQSAARFFGAAGDANLLIIRLVGRLTLLLEILDETGQRGPESGAQSQGAQFSPSWRRALQRQTEGWTSEALRKRLVGLLGAAGRVRRDPRLSKVLATRALWAVASGARKASR